MILLKSNFIPSEIVIVHNHPSPRKLDPLIEAKVEQAWSEELERARENNKQLWDAETYRIDEVVETSGKLQISMSTVKYSQIKTVKNFIERYRELGEEYYTKGGIVTALTLTKDGYYVFGRLSGKSTVNSKDYGYIGGSLTKSEMTIKDSIDLFNFLYKEVSEELNVARTEVKGTHICAVSLTDFLQIAFIFNLTLNLTKQELEVKLSDKQFEFSGLEFVKQEDVKEFINSNFEGWKQELVNLV